MLTQRDKEDLKKDLRKGNEMMNKHPSYLDLKLKISKKELIDHLIDNDPNFNSLKDVTQITEDFAVSETEFRSNAVDIINKSLEKSIQDNHSDSDIHGKLL